jgi:S1-C subfamily serine protease
LITVLFKGGKMSSLKNRIIAIIVVIVIAGAAYTAGVTGFFTVQKASAEPVLYSADTVTGIYDNASPAVVEIDTTQQSGLFNQLIEGQGSGFLIDNQGHILTNNHVVDGATSVNVILDNGNTVKADVLGTDAIDDLAVIGVNTSDVQGITPLQLGNSDQVKPGQMAIAIGNPYGLTDTVTVGIISGLNRDVGGSGLTGMLQTDAAINPGNSGGPLLDVNGTVIGINTAIEAQGGTSANGIGFAVPSNVVERVLTSLISGEKVARPWLGISATAITPTLAQNLNLTVSQGVYVISVTSGSPADNAGLKGGNLDASGAPAAGGDVISAVDGRDVKTVQELSSYFNTKKVGDTVTLTVIRDGSSMNLQVKLGAWPDTTISPAPTRQPRTPGFWGNGPTQ